MKRNLAILVILFLGGFLRFYKLDWGEGYFFHPDEYHIAIAVNRLDFPENLNPELFSYGSFSIYLIYFSKLILQSINTSSSVISPILIGRFYSALFSTVTLLLVFLLSKQIFYKKKFALLSSFTIAISPGLIQQAHFATPESILIFWFFLTLIFWLKSLGSGKIRYLILSALTLGAAAATKIVAVTYLPILVLIPFIQNNNYSIKSIFKKFISAIILLSTSLLVFFALFPYSLLDKNGFLHSMNYETSVAQGKLLVFYTRQFIDTTPLIFQSSKVFPYVLGPAVYLLGSLGIVLVLTVLVSTLVRKKKIDNKMTIILLSFFAYLIPNVVLFVKWTRFMAPILPFFCLFAIYTIYFLDRKRRTFLKIIVPTLIATLTALSTAWGLMFFSIYKKPDVRISSTKWINQNITQNSNILTEEGNTLEVPLTSGYNKIVFNFYKLDQPTEKDNLSQLLLTTDYFIVQSRRVFVNHQRLSKDFPEVSNFYNKLFSQELGFEKVKEFSSFPGLSFGPVIVEIDDELAEETWSVFDHPVIRIYQKTNQLTVEDYQGLLND